MIRFHLPGFAPMTLDVKLHGVKRLRIVPITPFTPRPTSLEQPNMMASKKVIEADALDDIP
jgi:hypothetical protein